MSLLECWKSAYFSKRVSELTVLEETIGPLTEPQTEDCGIDGDINERTKQIPAACLSIPGYVEYFKNKFY